MTLVSHVFFNKNGKIRNKLILLITLILALLQAPEINHLFSNKLNIGAIYIYSLRIVPIILLLSIIYFIISKKDIRENFNIPDIFSIIFISLYSLFELNGAESFDDLMRLIPSFLWIFSSLSLILITITNVHYSESDDKLFGFILVIIGILIFFIGLVENNFSYKKIDFNIYLLLGAILIIKNIKFLIIVMFFISIFSYYNQNRSIFFAGVIVIFIGLMRKPFINTSILKIFFLFIFTLMPTLFIYYESNELFTTSVLTGRAAIWSSWLNIITEDYRYFFFGIGVRSQDFLNISNIINIQNFSTYYHQPHSELIATLMRGGIILTIICYMYFLFIIVNSNKSRKYTSIFFALIIVYSFNGMYSFFYPLIQGLILIYILRPRIILIN